MGVGPQVRPELALGLLLGEELAAVDVARADTAVERDVPHPAGAQRRGRGVGLDAVGLDVPGDLEGDRAVAQQRVAEGDERLVERLVDQQAAEAGAVDEEVAAQRPVPVGDQVIDAAVLGQLDLIHLIDDLADAAPRGVPLEVLGQQAGVELVGVGVLDLVLGQKAVLRPPAAAEEVLHLVVEDAAVQEAGRQLVLAHRRDGEAGLVERHLVLLELQPPLAHVVAVDHLIALERVIEVGSVRTPAGELDRQLVGGVATRHPVLLLEAEEVEEELDGAESRLADADRPDVRGLDQGDVDARRGLFKIGRGHPTSRTSTYNNDTFRHDFSPQTNKRL